MSDEGQTEPAHRKPRPTVVIRCGHRGCPLKTSSACTAGRRAAVFSQDAWAFGCSLGTGTPTRLGLSTSERVIAVRRLLKRPRIGGSAEQRVLRGAAYVPVVEATELGNRYDVAGGRLHDLSRDGRIFVKREVSPGSQVVLDVVGQHATHAGCAQDDPARASDLAFPIVRPMTSRRCRAAIGFPTAVVWSPSRFLAVFITSTVSNHWLHERVPKARRDYLRTTGDFRSEVAVKGLYSNLSDIRERCRTMPHEDLKGVLSGIQAIEKFAGRLPEGDVEGHIRRSAHELTLAVEQRSGVEAAGERLMQAVRQLDEHNTTGRLRRDFEHEAPSVTRLLEAIREQLVPALKRAGYQV